MKRHPVRVTSTLGFSLIEALVAIVVLATGIVVILEGMQVSQTVLGAARDRIRCVRLADRLLREAEFSLRGGGLDLTTEGRRDASGAIYVWRRTATPVNAVGDGESVRSAGRLFEVEISVAPEDLSREFELVSRVWVPPPATGESQ